MKFFYIFCYIVGYVDVAHLGHLATFSANGISLCSAVAFLIFRNSSELVVHHQIGLYEHCYGIVDGRTAHTEFLLLLKVLHQLLNFEASVQGIYCLKNGKTLWRSPAFVLFQIFRKYLGGNVCNPVVFHVLPSAAKATRQWSTVVHYGSFNIQSYRLFFIIMYKTV